MLRLFSIGVRSRGGQPPGRRKRPHPHPCTTRPTSGKIDNKIATCRDLFRYIDSNVLCVG
jgi:hypothetical protein